MQNISISCRLCGAKKDISVDPSTYVKWSTGQGLVQDLFSNLSADDRELMISQTCGTCFDNLFPPENDYDED